MTRHVIEIPHWHPTPLNKLLHKNRFGAARLKAADTQVICVYANIAKATKAKGPRSLKIIITLAPRQRACDPDAYFKSCLDALVNCGYLVNDNRQNLTLLPTEFQRGVAYKTDIVLEDL